MADKQVDVHLHIDTKQFASKLQRWLDAEPPVPHCRGQLEIPFDLEDQVRLLQPAKSARSFERQDSER